MATKNGINDQFGLVASSGGRTGASLIDGHGGPPLIDEEGRLWVRVAGGAGGNSPDPAIPNAFQLNSGALTNNATIRDAGIPLLLTLLSGFIEAGSDTAVNYVQLYDLDAVPSGVPAFTCRLVGRQAFGWVPVNGWRFENGIRFAVSTAALSFVAGSPAWFNAQGWESP